MNKRNKKLFLAVLITSIIISTLTLSKYKTTLASKDKARVATPVISLSSSSLNVGIEINSNIEIPDYVFEVSNYDEQKESEVTMDYVLRVKTSNSLPLEFELYNYEDETQANLLTGNSTSKIRMDANQKTNQKYGLKIKWNKNQKDYLYSNEIDYIQLVLNSEQVD